MKRLLILGAGGHGKVVADAALLSGWDRVAFLDDRAGSTPEVLGLRVIGELRTLRDHAGEADAAVVAIGAAARRLELQEECVRAGLTIATIIHPSASVSRFVTLGPGSVVFAKAAIWFLNISTMGPISFGGSAVGSSPIILRACSPSRSGKPRSRTTTSVSPAATSFTPAIALGEERTS